MKAIIFDQFGGPEVLKLSDRPKPAPEAHEILIEVAAASVNPVDFKIRSGLYKDRMPCQFPVIPGWDAAGIVAETGALATRFKKGDRVYTYCRKDIVQHGTYAEFVTVNENSVALIPENLNMTEAAAVPLVALTAWQSLFEAGALRHGQSILIHAAAGGVGGFAVQFAHYTGAKIYATASAANHEYVKLLGADRIIDYTQDDFVAALKQLEPNGIDLVFDTVGGDVQTRSYDVLKKGGRIVSILAFENENLAAEKGVSQAYVFVQPSGAELQKITTLIEQGHVKAPEIDIMSLEKAAAAHARLETRHGRGKIILKIA